jgi:beta-glucosidase
MPKNEKNRFFPKDFFWGASTSAHQVEGGNYNQWSVWETAHAGEMAESAPKRLKRLASWDKIKKEATDPDNYLSGEGVKHFERYEKDFDLLKKLNLNAFRFTIEWSRIETIEGEFNQEAIDHYKRYIKELRKRNIEPILNIWHWTMPVWFTDKGGFKYKKNLPYFYRFVHLVAKELTEDVKYVITINEPNVYTTYGYLVPEPVSGYHWPPGEQNALSFMKVYLNLIKAHREAYYILKFQKHSLKVGLASHLANIQAKRPHNYLDELITEVMRYFWDWWFYRRTRKEQDFIGFNYYFTDYYRFKFPIVPEDPRVPLSDLSATFAGLGALQKADPHY